MNTFFILLLKKDWPRNTFAYASYNSNLKDLIIKLNSLCLDSRNDSNGYVYLSRNYCDKWDIVSYNGYLTIRNIVSGNYLMASLKGDCKLTKFSGQDEHLWFIGTNSKSTRLFNKATNEFLDYNQIDRIVTSPFYGDLKKSKKLTTLQPRTSLVLDTY